MEAVAVALSIALRVAPGAAVAGLVPVDGHGQVPGAKPLHQQVRVGVGTEHQVARRAELASDDDLRDARFCGDRGLTHRRFPSLLPPGHGPERVPGWLAAPPAGRRAAHGFRPRTAGSGPARWSPPGAVRPPGG